MSATTTLTAETTPAPLAQLAGELHGELHLPGSDDYARLATPWNVAVPSTPVAVVDVIDADDVSAAVRFAAAHDLQVSVQLTGHGAVSADRPTLLVHTGRLRELTIRPDGTARVGAGNNWADVIAAAAPYGLAGLAGSSPNVGVVGYLTGGGIGPVARTFGVSSDAVTAFDVVTGDGRIHHVDPLSRPDLFWALRGGKGTAGIVTAVEFELVALREIFGGCLYFDGADADAVLGRWSEWTADLPDAATSSLAVMRLPAMPGVPEPLAGRMTVAVRFAWVGDPDEGRRVIEPMTGAGRVVFGGVDVMPYSAIGMVHSDPVDPMPVMERTCLLGGLPRAAVDTVLDLVGPDAECPQVIVELRHLGGAIAKGPADGDAFDQRDAAYSVLAIGIAVPPVGDATRAHGSALVAALEPWSTGGCLPNFGPSTDPEQLVRKYRPATLARLARIADLYDPEHVLAAAAPVRAAALLG